jgi:hypothetical protein
MDHTATYTPPTDAADAYATVAGLIRHQANKFATRYGVNRDDAGADANYHFLMGHRAWLATDDHPRPYHIHIRLWVWYGLLDTARTAARRHALAPIVAMGDHVGGLVDNGFDATGFADQLGDDARTVLALVLDAPPEVAQVAAAKGGEGRNIRSTIRQWLADAGWAADRINESFSEIARAL